MFSKAVTYARTYPVGFWLIAAGWFVSALGFGLSVPFVSIYFHSQLGLTVTQIGLFFGFMAVVRSAFQVFGGELADRLERRSLLIWFQIIRSASFVIMAVAVYSRWGFAAVAVSLVVNSIFGALYQPVANAAVADILPESRRLDGYALTRSAINLGWATGPALGGFMAERSFGTLFLVSGVLTLAAAAVMVWLRLPPPSERSQRFRWAELIAVRSDPFLMVHGVLTFVLYLVHSQLIAPFSVYAVEMVRISEHQLGMLYAINGLMVVSLQIPVTRRLSRLSLTLQMAVGTVFYAAGYALVGVCTGFALFAVAVIIVTAGEIVVSPPALTLTARLAPKGRTGRYMGIYGFAMTSGWSFGPLYGGLLLDRFSAQPVMAWVLVAMLAMMSGAGYLMYSKKLPDRFNR
jgi:MFS family permease